MAFFTCIVIQVIQAVSVSFKDELRPLIGIFLNIFTNVCAMFILPIVSTTPDGGGNAGDGKISGSDSSEILKKYSLSPAGPITICCPPTTIYL